jgi:hypothetical protein
MPFRTIVLPAGLGLSALLVVSAARAETAAPRRPPARVYTNEDLDRVHPASGETGVRSVPAAVPVERRARPAGDEDRPRSRGEAYWREEARRVRERVAELAAKAEELRAQIAADEDEQRHLARPSRSGRAARSRASLSGGADPAASARLASLLLRMRALEDDLLERARRDGALPGWLR